MIACIFHEGSGLGNQLARYVAVRCLAIEKGYEFGIIQPENFKGKSFLNLDIGVPIHDLLNEFNENKTINDQGHDVRGYDPSILEVRDFTLLDGEFQDERYFISHIEEIREWLTTEEIYCDEDTCIINFRGGEYVGVKDLFLPKEYWDKAIQQVRYKNPAMYFIVVTDDVQTARRFFPDFQVEHDLIADWQSIRYARNLILSNSSFAILPALLNGTVDNIIAPLFWAGYNKGYWQLPQNNYKKFTYIHHEDNT